MRRRATIAWDHRGAEVAVRAGSRRLWLTVFCCFSWIAIWGVVSQAMRSHSPLLPIMAPLAIGAFAIISGINALLTHRWRPERLVSRRLAANKCGVCAYPVADLPREEDGCAVCPECGAAWRVGKGTEGQRDEGTEEGS